MSFSTSYVLLHQSMALEELGHTVHLFNVSKPPMRLLDYLEAYDFDLIFLDLEFLRNEDLPRTLHHFRTKKAIRFVGALYSLVDLPETAWECVDFCVTPWKGKTVEALARTRDLRYLPMGYNARLHRRQNESARMGAVYVGNARANTQREAEEYLSTLVQDGVVQCIGAGYEPEYLDPFMLGRVYAVSRCLPNFHYAWGKGEDCILNERFWQTARCGVPVNDYSLLMGETWDTVLVQNFCFVDKREWQDRVRALNSGKAVVDPALLTHLDEALEGHSYRDRMKQLLDWLRP